MWWPRDNCSYGGTIVLLTQERVEIAYEDGTTKRYRIDGTREDYTMASISTRIAVGEVLALRLG